MSAEILRFPGADIDTAWKEATERRRAKARKGWETRRANGWQRRSKAESEGAQLGDHISRAVKLLRKMAARDAECWLAIAEANQDGGGAA
jgi:hypothetical protein